MLKLSFDLMDEVVIADVDVHGFIDRIELGMQDNQYRVVYWLDGSRHETWMYACELRKVGR